MQVVKPFSLLARVYDAIMQDVDYEAWVDFILATVKARGWQGHKVLDIGCGTGNATFPLYARGFEVTGLDASAEMLRFAREKLPPVKFVQADFSSFELNERFDLIVSVFDSLNNLLKPEQFLQALLSVYKHLTPGGMFIFDVNTTTGLRDLWESGRAEGWSGEVYYRWEHSFDERTGLARVEAYCSDEKQEFTEVHFERPYDPPELLELMLRAGFDNVAVLSYPDGHEALLDEVRVWVVGEKNEGL